MSNLLDTGVTDPFFSVTPSNLQKPFQSPSKFPQPLSSPSKNIRMPQPNTKKSITEISSNPNSQARPFSDDEDKDSSTDVPKIDLNFNSEAVF